MNSVPGSAAPSRASRSRPVTSRPATSMVMTTSASRAASAAEPTVATPASAAAAIAAGLRSWPRTRCPALTRLAAMGRPSMAETDETDERHRIAPVMTSRDPGRRNGARPRRRRHPPAGRATRPGCGPCRPARPARLRQKSGSKMRDRVRRKSRSRQASRLAGRRRSAASVSLSEPGDAAAIALAAGAALASWRGAQRGQDLLHAVAGIAAVDPGPRRRQGALARPPAAAASTASTSAAEPQAESPRMTSPRRPEAMRRSAKPQAMASSGPKREPVSARCVPSSPGALARSQAAPISGWKPICTSGRCQHRALGHHPAGAVAADADAAAHGGAVHQRDHRLGIAGEPIVERIFLAEEGGAGGDIASPHGVADRLRCRRRLRRPARARRRSPPPPTASSSCQSARAASIWRTSGERRGR